MCYTIVQARPGPNPFYSARARPGAGNNPCGPGPGFRVGSAPCRALRCRVVPGTVRRWSARDNTRLSFAKHRLWSAVEGALTLTTEAVTGQEEVPPASLSRVYGIRASLVVAASSTLAAGGLPALCTDLRQISAIRFLSTSLPLCLPCRVYAQKDSAAMTETTRNRKTHTHTKGSAHYVPTKVLTSSYVT